MQRVTITTMLMYKVLRGFQKLVRLSDEARRGRADDRGEGAPHTEPSRLFIQTSTQPLFLHRCPYDGGRYEATRRRKEKIVY